MPSDLPGLDDPAGARCPVTATPETLAGAGQTRPGGETFAIPRGTLRRMADACVALLLGALLATPAAQAIVIDFEDLLDQEVVTTQYDDLGVTFENATALTAA